MSTRAPHTELSSDSVRIGAVFVQMRYVNVGEEPEITTDTVAVPDVPSLPPIVIRMPEPQPIIETRWQWAWRWLNTDVRVISRVLVRKLQNWWVS